MSYQMKYAKACAEIAELERIILEQGKTLNLYNTGAIKADAIRDMVANMKDTHYDPAMLVIQDILDYIRNLEK